MNRKQKYEAKAEAHSAIADLITGALENGEFKDLSELGMQQVGRILKQMERGVERNQAYAINPPAPKPRKPKAKVLSARPVSTTMKVIDADSVFGTSTHTRSKRK